MRIYVQRWGGKRKPQQLLLLLQDCTERVFLSNSLLHTSSIAMRTHIVYDKYIVQWIHAT